MRIKDKKVVELKRKLKKIGIRGLALDIDDTLAGTLLVVVQKLNEKIKNPEGLTVEEIIKKYRHTNNIPYWQSKEASEIIQSVTFVDGAQKDLPLIENSKEIVQKINKIIPIVAYVTVRPPGVINGTKHWLKKHNFPNAPVIFKPRGVGKRNGNQWKAKVLEYLYPEIIGIVDDNDGLQKFFSKKYEGTVFLYGGKENRKDINVVERKDWEDVIKKIKA